MIARGAEDRSQESEDRREMLDAGFWMLDTRKKFYRRERRETSKVN